VLFNKFISFYEDMGTNCVEHEYAVDVLYFDFTKLLIRFDMED